MDTYFCKACRTSVHWEDIVTTGDGPGHIFGQEWHLVIVVPTVATDAFFDNAMLWLTVLETFTEGNGAAALLRDLADTMGQAEAARMQVTGGLNVGAIMLNVIADITGTTTTDAAAMIRALMLQQRMAE